MTARPTLTDVLAASTRKGTLVKSEIVAALHAGGFTIQCDRCKGSGTTTPAPEALPPPLIPRLCYRCGGSGVLPVGILPAPVDENALREAIEDALIDVWMSGDGRQAGDLVMAVLRDTGVLSGVTP